MTREYELEYENETLRGQVAVLQKTVDWYKMTDKFLEQNFAHKDAEIDRRGERIAELEENLREF